MGRRTSNLQFVQLSELGDHNGGLVTAHALHCTKELYCSWGLHPSFCSSGPSFCSSGPSFCIREPARGPPGATPAALGLALDLALRPALGLWRHWSAR